MTCTKSRPAIGAALAVLTSLLIFATACGGHSSASSTGGTGVTGVTSTGSGSGSSGSSSSGLSTTCGSGASNCVPLTSDNGLAGGYVDGAFTTVTVCVPGAATPTCESINGVLVDTGSVGLRLFKSAVSINLPPSTATGNDLLDECYSFVDSFMWGPVATADIQIGGETASSAPIMLIDDSTTAVPSTCSSGGGTQVSSAADFGANGILGIGSTKQDCGLSCVGSASPSSPASYYDCATNVSTCTETTASLTAQVPNPVSLFAVDNNGTAMSLPPVSSTGTATLTGALYFGIGTQSNNTMPSTTAVLTLDNLFNITTTYKGTINSQSFIDSGSNGYFFVDSTIPNPCPTTATDPFGSDWFCPTSTLALSATNSGAAGSSGSSTVSFSVANANTLFNTQDTSFGNLGGPGTANTFDWGLPFFYGRVVYNAIELEPVTDTGGTTFTGPFVAY